MTKERSPIQGIDWEAIQKFLKKVNQRRIWNKILHRPDECKYWHMNICLYKAMHEPLLGQKWSTCECGEVCEDFALSGEVEECQIT